jgi:hypothetical protein
MNIINLQLKKSAAVIAAIALLSVMLLSAVPALAAAPAEPVITTVTQSTTTNPITLTGTADANTSIQVTGGASTSTASSTAGGAWSVSVSLQPNVLNTLSVVSFNTDGEFSSTSTVAITHDATGPSAPVITFPSGPIATSSSPVTITGTAEANSNISVSGGNGTATTTTNGSGNFSLMVALNPNSLNTLSFTATDALNNTSASTTLAVTYDTTAPTLTINGDASMNVFSCNSFTDPGVSVSDALDSSITASSTGSVDIGHPGSYTITYTATDDAGNTASTTRSVIVVNCSAGGGGSSRPAGNGNGPIAGLTNAFQHSGNPVVGAILAGFINGFTPSVPSVFQGVPGIPATGGSVLGTAIFQFNSNLSVGMSGMDVSELQSRLSEINYFNGPITGYFGPKTQAAVKKLQRNNGLTVTGQLDAATRALLNS